MQMKEMKLTEREEVRSGGKGAAREIVNGLTIGEAQDVNGMTKSVVQGSGFGVRDSGFG